MESKKAGYYIISSLYVSFKFREKVLGILNNIKITKSVQETSDVDLELLVKHCSQAEKMNNKKYFALFIIFLIGILCWLIIPRYFFSIGVVLICTTYVYLVTEEFTWETFIRQKIKDKNIVDMPLKNYDNKLVETVLKHKISSLYYYKDYYPYYNNGIPIGGWSIPVDITKVNDKSKSLATSEFQDGEIYDAITRQIESLKFENLIFGNNVYVNSAEITKDNFFYRNETLLNEPDEDLITKAINSKSDKFRFYKMVRIKDWNDDLVFTVLFRVYKSSEIMYIETQYFILPSLLKEAKQVDQIKDDIKISQAISILIKNLFFTPIQLIASPIVILKNILGTLNIPRMFLDLFSDKDTLELYVGDCLNIDKIFRSEYYTNYFQGQDKEFYLKTIEKRILNTIIDFLEKRNIDISDFKESKTHILNNGIIMSGGEMKGENITVGKKNKIQTNSTE